ncbi:Predicted arabinose efflux permease, MFS family [Marinobacter antarcticus]|uniref:Predicted arabinose efflux permease, MFS family n=1 Tax=Marinobacter antarcticus TaxID=564117 RepID=A0A1M6RBY4_9GAMM|nr:MFS transporter [Marinobacter antarcticus]SHK29952.1 Predicted arabinose efflux permease, MFS family [Marinobacter antarcticus]
MNVHPGQRPPIPKTVWALGFVSLTMDVSSELVHSLLPLLLVSTLGASMLTVGIIEGIAQATALIVKVFSGVVSDMIQRRKILLLIGYGLAALTKPLFPLAESASTVFLARFVDRIGKGIRGAPRDALIADVSPQEIRGASFGLRQTMDTMGAFIGPGLAIGLMLLLHNQIQLVLWFAVIPAFICIGFIVFGVHEVPASPSASPSGKRRPRFPLSRNELSQLSRAYWWVVIIGAVFSLARFSEAFLILKAQQTGFENAWVPLVMVVMAAFFSLSAYPAGWLSDRVERQLLLIVGLVLLIVADLVLSLSDTVGATLIGTALWGLHMGFSQGILAAMVADATPAHLKGTAFGVFSLVSGVAMLIASILAGALWSYWGPSITFLAGALFALVSLLLVFWSIHHQFRKKP